MTAAANANGQRRRHRMFLLLLLHESSTVYRYNRVSLYSGTYHTAGQCTIVNDTCFRHGLPTLRPRRAHRAQQQHSRSRITVYICCKMYRVGTSTAPTFVCLHVVIRKNWTGGPGETRQSALKSQKNRTLRPRRGPDDLPAASLTTRRGASSGGRSARNRDGSAWPMRP